ncbi:phosphoserine phosphatase SerB [Sneathiella aquimaris]|uniref:phosphoserine phosphatase SerB n=1 Tax=Sneathiella aquimaris TaxID=2599305 RepID=UPI001469E36F|nr:phosphoserine phosphatase SerB [Sneathiella aquimaris]
MTTKVLTLVANPNNDRPFSSIVDQLVASLTDAHVEIEKLDWLALEIACDLYVGKDFSLELIAEFMDKADFCLQPEAGRKKKLMLADMDSTIITVECIDELADFAGLKAEVSAITEKAMNGELDFNEAFKARVAMLKGLPEETLQKTFEHRVRLTPGARTLVRTMKANGAYTALVSGGFTFFTSRVREITGFDMDDSNRLLFENGKLTGEAAEPILNSQAKLDNLNRLKAELNLQTEDVAAIGDGANDIPMIEAAGLGVSYHAKPAAEKAADASIRFGDLTTLLFYQGYRAEEFIR